MSERAAYNPSTKRAGLWLIRTFAFVPAVLAVLAFVLLRPSAAATLQDAAPSTMGGTPAESAGQNERGLGRDQFEHPWLDRAIDLVTVSVEVAGILVIVLGALVATLLFFRGVVRDKRAFPEVYHGFRSNLGRAILLGLEFLVAADIINTVAIKPTLQSVLVLGLIVLIRTFLSFSLEIEITGRLPWRGAAELEGETR